ncbi:MAG: monovalent cation/H+ antiporter subunit D family protein [Desulfobacterales bacterium]|nr:monovalent cation/H+ antiporter subunit D family protein [Desulfobacterales bacterium]
MSTHYPALIIVVPLLTAVIVAAVGWINKKYCFPLSVASLAASLLSSIGLLFEVMKTNGEVVYRFAGWEAPMGIVYNIDYLNSLVLIVVTAVALINLIFSKGSIENDFPDKEGVFYALYILFTTGLVGMVATGDAFNLYVLLEIASLTGYALLGIGNERSPLSTLNYLFIGTIGATFYLLGVGYIYIATGTLNMAEIALIIPKLPNVGIIKFAFVICMVGLFVKMALFPMHGWLPNAYSNAPSSSIGLIAPLTTKVTVYIMVRAGITIFTPEFTFEKMHLDKWIVWLSVIGIVMGSCFALAQKNYKKMLTYIVVAEVGYMVGGFWLGNKLGITGSILHIVNDAAMTLCVFMAAGIFSYKIGDHISDFKGLFKKMPFTMTAFAVGGLSIIGVPPTCGFFSKWYLVSGGIEAVKATGSIGALAFIVALLFSSLVNAVLFFRIFEVAHFEPFSEGHGHEGHSAVEINEAPLGMLIPFFIVAFSLIFLGIFSGDIVSNIINQFIPVLPAGI